MPKEKASKAQQKAINKYSAKAYDRITLLVPKGRKAAIQDYAARRDGSVNALFNRLLAEELRKNGVEYVWPPKNEKD